MIFCLRDCCDKKNHLYLKINDVRTYFVYFNSNTNIFKLDDIYVLKLIFDGINDIF